MINLGLFIVTALFLFILTIVDFKYKKIPSIVTTSYLLGLAILFPEQIIYSIIMALFGLFLYEAGDGGIGGIADIKALALLGFFVPSTKYILLMIGFVMIIGLIYKIFSKYVLKYKYETPYMIVFLLTFLIFHIFV